MRLAWLCRLAFPVLRLRSISTGEAVLSGGSSKSGIISAVRDRISMALESTDSERECRLWSGGEPLPLPFLLATWGLEFLDNKRLTMTVQRVNGECDSECHGVEYTVCLTLVYRPRFFSNDAYLSGASGKPKRRVLKIIEKKCNNLFWLRTIRERNVATMLVCFVLSYPSRSTRGSACSVLAL